MIKLMITPDEIAAKAAEYYPYETEKTIKDNAARELRNKIIDMVRQGFVVGVKYAVVELNKK